MTSHKCVMLRLATCTIPWSSTSSLPNFLTTENHSLTEAGGGIIQSRALLHNSTSCCVKVSEYGIRLDQSQEPLANTISDTTGRTHIGKDMEGPGQSCGEYQAAVSFRPTDNNPLSSLEMANRAETTSQHKYKSLLLKSPLS